MKTILESMVTEDINKGSDKPDKEKMLESCRGGYLHVDLDCQD